MTGTGTETELHKTAEEGILDRERLISAPEIRGTAKKGISKEQCSLGATNFIISAGNIAPNDESPDRSPEASAGSQRRPDGHRGAGKKLKTTTAGVVPSPLKTDYGKGALRTATSEDVLSEPSVLGAATAEAVPMAAGSDAAEILHSRGGRRDTSGKAKEPVRFSNRHVGIEAAFKKMGAADGSMRVVRGTEFGQDDGSKEAATGVSLSPLKASPGGRVHQPMAGEKVRLNHRHIGKEKAFVGTGAGPDGSAATIEAAGSGKTETAGAFGNPTRAGGSGESHQGSGDGGPSSGSVPPLLRTGPVEHVRVPVTGEKVTPLPGAFAAAAVDTITAGSNTGEGTLAAGRQTVLMTQVIEAAQPLVQRGGGRILISLNPPSLGALEIDVRVKRDSVELFVTANNQDVQQTLCSHVEQLRKALFDQGLNMDRFQVVVGDRSADQQGSGPRQEGMTGGHGEARSDRAYHPEAADENVNDGSGTAVRPDMYPSIGGINLFI